MYAMLAIQLAIARQKRQPFYSNNVKKNRPGQSSCGWRTTRPRPYHGHHNLQTWTPLKTSRM